MVILPTNTRLATYSFSTELESIIFKFRFQFNDRDQSWFFDVLTAEGVPIRQGVKVVTNFPLLARLALASRPPGELVAIDTTGEDIRAVIGQLGIDRQVKFIYFESDEVPDPLFG